MTKQAPEQQNEPIEAHLSPLGEIELEACRLRFEGYTTPETELALSRCYRDRTPKAKTIRSWFARGGKLYEFYKSYAEEETRIRRSMAKQIFQAHVKNAARTMVQIMNNPNCHAAVRFRAAQYIVDREFGLPLKTIIETEIKDPATRILMELGIIQNTPQNL